jgi:hypothetical protein
MSKEEPHDYRCPECQVLSDAVAAARAAIARAKENYDTARSKQGANSDGVASVLKSASALIAVRKAGRATIKALGEHQMNNGCPGDDARNETVIHLLRRQHR